MLNKGNLKNIIFIFGLGVAIGYYAITSLTMIIAFLKGGTCTIIWTNIYGEAGIEFVITIVSIPCVIFMVKESIDLYKKNKGGCSPIE